ncbi:MerR family transcriptional regulator [Streptomyces sp. NPDC007100]|uniref:MerR family transcriptional regulator n=1 Tax=Streptomyces sp. NPDC007100 TaxID=3155602 RepID=UPI0033EEA7AF
MRIGELAALAGVTTRTVRHYHHLGLLPEPERLANGYREYRLRDAVTLARVRRLTELGLGLSEVRDVLADDAGRELREVLGELDADLARQEEEIRRRRKRLEGLLRQVEKGHLPDEGPYSEQLTALVGEMQRVSATLPGPEPAMAVTEREMLSVLEMAAGSSEEGERMISVLQEAAMPPGAMERAYEVYALLDELVGVEPGDPRVEEAARALAACVPDGLTEELRRVEQEGEAGGSRLDTGFLGSYFAGFAPAQEEAVRWATRMVLERDRE